MTKEDKKLVLKELCCRLPHNTKIHIIHKTGLLEPHDNLLTPEWIKKFYKDEVEIKPYLRPISDLTEEECTKLFQILDINEEAGDWLKINDINILRLFTEDGKDFYEIAAALDYLYSIHVDFRDMIEEGLAIETKKKDEKIYNSDWGCSAFDSE